MRRAALLLVLTTMAGAVRARQAPLPYAEAGLTPRQAAVHLLNRLAYGPRPGEVDRVVAMGLETWVEHQLAADLPEPTLPGRLARFRALDLDAGELRRTYPPPTLVRRMAIEDSLFTREALAAMDRDEARRRLRQYMADHGYRPLRELLGTLYAQKLLRARYAENQLTEVLVDFWFNHFNVALQDNQARPFLLGYERDAIRPHVLGTFREMLGATARHPAMMLYLDNARSFSAAGVPTTMDVWAGRRWRPRREASPEAERRQGINENYARELMELHTLGVDGGYTQADVEQVARAFTGWTVLPPGPRGETLARRLRRQTRRGFVLDGDFVFLANRHDADEKVILGHVFPAGGGLDEGERVLDLLAAHPATARHVARKLAVCFVSDDPPEALVDDLARVFRETGGDLWAVMRALIWSPYFWAPEARVKSPFELAVSALRALDADVRDGREVLRQVEDMGQPLYAYPAPTGYPDRADYWVNTGTLVSRMNFGMALAEGRIRGVRVNLATLPGTNETGSPDARLRAYLRLLLPGTAPEPLLASLLPLVAAPSPDAAATGPADTVRDRSTAFTARAVGFILGTPDFQRH